MKLKPISIILSTVFVGLAIVAYHWHPMDGRPAAQAPAQPAAMEPAIRYPVPPPKLTDQAQPKTEPSESQAKSKSDDNREDTFVQRFIELIGQDRFDSTFVPKELVRRFVVTAENATSSNLPNYFSFYKPLIDGFRVDRTSQGMVLSRANFARYTPYVDLLATTNSEKLVSIYAQFYPLFQSAYAELGTNGYFNDRLVAVIDNILEAPEITAPIRLKLKGYYKFEDLKLESLPVGQKIVIRMGPRNAALVKDQLRHLREQLTRLKN